MVEPMNCGLAKAVAIAWDDRFLRKLTDKKVGPKVKIYWLANIQGSEFRLEAFQQPDSGSTQMNLLRSIVRSRVVWFQPNQFRRPIWPDENAGTAMSLWNITKLWTMDVITNLEISELADPTWELWLRSSEFGLRRRFYGYMAISFQAAYRRNLGN